MYKIHLDKETLYKIEEEAREEDRKLEELIEQIDEMTKDIK